MTTRKTASDAATLKVLIDCLYDQRRERHAFRGSGRAPRDRGERETEGEAARALLEFLSTPAAARVIKAKGLNPAIEEK